LEQREKAEGDLRKCYNEELRNLYFYYYHRGVEGDVTVLEAGTDDSTNP
jgi:hypothetical protein